MMRSSEKMNFPGDEWEYSTPEDQGVDPLALEEALQYLAQNSGRDGIKEVVIARNGYIIWKGDNVHKVHGVWSVTKSFTSTVLGLLIDDGLASLDTLAKDYLPELGLHYSDVTLRHFTTMTSGYRAQGDEPRGSYVHGPSQTPFLPSDEPLFYPPGSMYAYWDSAMNQFAHVMTRIAGRPLQEIFKERIADQIGMKEKLWEWGNFGVINGLLVNGGSGNNNRQIRICASEIARLGHLFLNRGQWKGRQLLSSDWVDAATSVQVPASIPLHELSGADGRGVYGFNWWVNGIKHDGTLKWPGAPEGTYAAMGYNNNAMFVIPEWKVVFVRLGLDQDDFNMTDNIYSCFIERFGKAIKD